MVTKLDSRSNGCGFESCLIQNTRWKWSTFKEGMSNWQAACSPHLNFLTVKMHQTDRFWYEMANGSKSGKKLIIFLNCGSLTVFQSLNVIVGLAHRFEFDMPGLICQLCRDTFSVFVFRLLICFPTVLNYLWFVK